MGWSCVAILLVASIVLGTTSIVLVVVDKPVPPHSPSPPFDAQACVRCSTNTSACATVFRNDANNGSGATFCGWTSLAATAPCCCPAQLPPASQCALSTSSQCLCIAAPSGGTETGTRALLLVVGCLLVVFALLVSGVSWLMQTATKMEKRLNVDAPWVTDEATTAPRSWYF
ncbi:Aste57867_10471 [Aphanomyces stellatus]|uniref:Aste57867_10471 protein n=1 Tax=Aphanomyces stellatus TaxID=120398 RepID=A0A485KQF8_9STRA|nr:hypothetical protein As57867_010431 [Aphanomyces stellatus]VFT87345.1 Aste57867_10471 [Aphanomyces stellatus]